MSDIVALIFWLSVLILFYIYMGYPLLVTITAAIFKSSVKKEDIFPKVSLIISVYNEEKIIIQKLENSLALTYPEKIEIIVASDCSTDETDEIVKKYSNKGVVLNRISERRGKTLALNDTIPKTNGDIIVFSDANAIYEPDAIEKMVRNFNDEAVGCVSGESRYILKSVVNVAKQERSYWNYERFLKIKESQIRSLVGADGAIFAIRRKLYEPLTAEDINDFIVPLNIVKTGLRVVYEKDAVAYEDPVLTGSKAFKQKMRIINRSWNGLFKVMQLLNPFKYGFLAIQLISHKLLRWLTPFFMIFMILSNIFLLSKGWIYQLVLVLQLLFYLSALLGFITEKRVGWPKFLYTSYYFCMISLAALIGVIKSLFGKVEITWQHSRE